MFSYGARKGLLTTGSAFEPPHGSNKPARLLCVLMAILGSFLPFLCLSNNYIHPVNEEQWELETRSLIKANSQWHQAQLFRYFLWQPGYFNFCFNLQITFLLLLQNILTDFTIFIPCLLQNSEEDSWWQGLQAVQPSANLFSVTGMVLTMCIHPYTSWCDQVTAVWALKLLICYVLFTTTGMQPNKPCLNLQELLAKQVLVFLGFSCTVQKGFELYF